MSLVVTLFRKIAARRYNKRDAGLGTPPDIQRQDDIAYGPHGKENLLDVYYPKHTQEPLPTIVNVHGGAFTFGNKEFYQYYGMSLARRGFVVLNINYRIAPEAKFPAPLEDTNRVMEWLLANAERYYIDVDKIFMVGDSAGAQIASQYAAAVTNPVYAEVLGIVPPPVDIRGLGLNGGLYDLVVESRRSGMIGQLRKAYFGPKPEIYGEKLRVLDYITKDYPPAHITTAPYDHLRNNAPAMADVLKTHGVQVVCKEYGTEADKHLKHVFHLDVREETANRCNDEQCTFFRQLIAAPAH